jgi:hypothetical protein
VNDDILSMKSSMVRHVVAKGAQNMLKVNKIIILLKRYNDSYFSFKQSGIPTKIIQTKVLKIWQVLAPFIVLLSESV